MQELHAALAIEDDDRRASLDTLLSLVLDHSLGPASPTIEIIQLVGDRWSALILTLLATGTFRPSELRRVISLMSRIGSSNPISQRVLTAKLRTYERLGLVDRTVWPTVPPRTEYTMTPLGHELVRLIETLARWCLTNEARVNAALRAYDAAGSED